MGESSLSVKLGRGGGIVGEWKCRFKVTSFIIMVLLSQVLFSHISMEQRGTVVSRS